MNTKRPARRKVVPGVDPLESRQLLSTGTGLSLAQSPDITRSHLFGTAAVAPDDIWAVGYTDPNAGTSSALIEHFDGTSWSVVPAAPVPPGDSTRLLHVAAVASDDVWAAGDQSSSTSPLIEHWDGTSWSVVPSPALQRGGTFNALTAIASDDVWAVGSLGNGRGGNLIEHFDGTSWSVVTAPSFTSSDALLGVSGTSANDVWAVGESGRHPGVEVLHWDGTSWSKVPAPSPAFDSVLTSVTALAPDNVWAVGHTNAGPVQTLIEHWDGTSWSVVDSPNMGGSSLFADNALSGVAAVTPDDIWAVGFFTDPSTDIQRTLTEHWDGTSWSVVDSPNATTGFNTLAGVTALGDGTVVAVGTAGDMNDPNTNGLILQK